MIAALRFTPTPDPSPRRVEDAPSARWGGERVAARRSEPVTPIWSARARVAAAVVDPEIPVLTLEDLGVLRGVERREGRHRRQAHAHLHRLPGDAGDPARGARRRCVEAGFADAQVETVLSPPWSTDDITEEGRRKLKEFGIAPPARGATARTLFAQETVACPKCGSTATSQDLRVRLDRVQGAVALRGLRRALRLFQVPLSAEADARLPAARDCRGQARDARGRSPSRFAIPEALREAFRFKPGQHLTVRATHRRRGAAAHLFDLLVPGRAPPAHRHQARGRRALLQLGQRHAEGRAARSRSCRRRGASCCPQGDGTPRHVVAFAAGAGITPIIAMVKHALAQRAGAPASRSSTATARSRASCSARSWRT